MNEANGTGQSQNILNQLGSGLKAGNQGGEGQTNASENEANKNRFLELMVTQMKHQNPLDPKKGAEFMSQLAQFSQVNSLDSMNSQMSELTNTFRSGRALQASSLVGRSVQVEGNQATLPQDGPLQGSVNLDSSAESVNVNIKGPSGQLLQQLDLGAQGAGDVSFQWDGMSQKGEMMPPGQYTVEATAARGGGSTSLPVSVQANVDSVSLGKGEDVTLNVSGIGSVPLSNVKAIAE